MGEITLVRHGQANSTATDEESYDKLSDLGWRQGRWLGDYLRHHEEGFDLIRDWIARPESSEQIRLERGDCLIFDNSRMLHGRTAFPKDGGRALFGLWCDGVSAHPDLRFGIPSEQKTSVRAA